MSTDNTTTTPSHYEAVKALIDKVRALQSEIPNFTYPKTSGDNRRLSRAASVPPQFVVLTASAVQTNPVLVRGGGADPAHLRDLIDFAESYKALADEIEACGRFLRHTITAAKNEAGVDALTTYSLAQRLAKDPRTAYLVPVVESLRRELSRKPAKPQQQTTPQPQPSPVNEPKQQ